MAEVLGTVGDDTLGGGVEDDVLRGLEGDDTLDGGDGIDVLVGGIGDDTYVVGETRREIDGVLGDWRDSAEEDEDAGTDTVVWMGIGGYRLGANIENGVAGTRFGGVITGNELNNTITGWSGDDGNWLSGEGGDDTLTGGRRDDRLDGGSGADVLIGYDPAGPASDVLDQDELDGGSGADVMSGGQGYDIYWADDLGDRIVELAIPDGADDTLAYYYSYDAVYWTGAGAYVLPEHVEYLHLRGGATEALGNDQANVIWSDYGSFDRFGEYLGDGAVTVDAGGGADILIGGNGADTMAGGAGDDQVNGEDGGDTLRGGDGDDLILGGSLDFGGADALFGDAGDDRLEGGSGDDALDGGDGIDVLLGGHGDDVLTGGAGLDRFSFGDGSDTATDFTGGEDVILGEFDWVTVTQDGADTLIAYREELGFGTASLRLIGVDASTVSAADFVSQLEGSGVDDTLVGDEGDDYVSGGDGDDAIDGGGGDDAGDGGTGDDDMDGGDGADDLSGGGGDDVIDGGEGGDDMDGGDGDDTFVIDSGDDEVIEDEDGGDDTVIADISYTLDDNVEDLVLVDDAAASLRADGAARLDGTGNALANRITGSQANNRLSGMSGDDLLRGREESDVLVGGDGNDRLVGDLGDDVLAGGVGHDRLRGGMGADRFVIGDGNRDRVSDFDAAGGDTIQIRSAFADSFDDLTLTTRGAHTIVSWTGGSVLLANVSAASLSAADFGF